MSRLAGLNIGIASTIWAVQPFFVAFCERVLFRVRLCFYQFVGMFFLVVMAIFIALSDLFGPEAPIDQLQASEKQAPVYIAVLYSFIFPIAGTFMVMLTAYVNRNLKLSSNDWI